jgi:hypothetical protein
MRSEDTLSRTWLTILPPKRDGAVVEAPRVLWQAGTFQINQALPLHVMDSLKTGNTSRIQIWYCQVICSRQFLRQACRDVERNNCSVQSTSVTQMDPDSTSSIRAKEQFGRDKHCQRNLQFSTYPLGAPLM